LMKSSQREHVHIVVYRLLHCMESFETKDYGNNN
jgi:hypothetical protein